MKVLNIISATLWGVLLLGTIFGVVEPTRLLFGITVGTLFISSISDCIID